MCATTLRGLILLLAVCFLAHEARAQVDVGFRGGAFSGWMSGDDAADDRRMGFAGGAFMGIPVSASFQIYTELFFTSHGGAITTLHPIRNEEGFVTGWEEAPSDVRFYGLEIPLAIRYVQPLTERMSLRLYSGPMAGLVIRQDMVRIQDLNRNVLEHSFLGLLLGLDAVLWGRSGSDWLPTSGPRHLGVGARYVSGSDISSVTRYSFSPRSVFLGAFLSF